MHTTNIAHKTYLINKTFIVNMRLVQVKLNSNFLNNVANNVYLDQQELLTNTFILL